MELAEGGALRAGFAVGRAGSAEVGAGSTRTGRALGVEGLFQTSALGIPGTIDRLSAKNECATGCEVVEVMAFAVSERPSLVGEELGEWAMTELVMN
jgi:hypothetical protein